MAICMQFSTRLQKKVAPLTATTLLLSQVIFIYHFYATEIGLFFIRLRSRCCCCSHKKNCIQFAYLRFEGFRQTYLFLKQQQYKSIQQ